MWVRGECGRGSAPEEKQAGIQKRLRGRAELEASPEIKWSIETPGRSGCL
jgi:hypothetical protein